MAMEKLWIPELAREPLQQFRMAGALALGTESVLRLHQSVSELAPSNDDDDAGGEAIISGLSHLAHCQAVHGLSFGNGCQQRAPT